MSTVLIVGLGDLAGWALEFLARSPGIDRIVTMRRSKSSLASIAAISAVFQSSLVRTEHITGDVTDVSGTAQVLADIDPDVIFTAATLRSPRGLMTAAVDPDIRAILRRATFGMWLPAHLLPATRLTQAALAAGATAPIVNIAYPDVVNAAVWKHLGYGPRAGAGNGEVSAARLNHHLATRYEVPLRDVKVAVVASHAFFVHGREVPHWARAWVEGRDVTNEIDVDAALTAHPEAIDWTKATSFSLFAASAVKNLLALLSDDPWYTHVAAPNGLPGGYPANVSRRGIELALPDDLTADEAVEINAAGNRFDGIEAIEDDGTVVFTAETTAAMAELGYDGERVRPDELDERVAELNALFERIAT